MWRIAALIYCIRNVFRLPPQTALGSNTIEQRTQCTFAGRVAKAHIPRGVLDPSPSIIPLITPQPPFRLLCVFSSFLCHFLFPVLTVYIHSGDED